MVVLAKVMYSVVTRRYTLVLSTPSTGLPHTPVLMFSAGRDSCASSFTGTHGSSRAETESSRNKNPSRQVTLFLRPADNIRVRRGQRGFAVCVSETAIDNGGATTTMCISKSSLDLSESYLIGVK